jgi:hypothetical protein
MSRPRAYRDSRARDRLIENGGIFEAARSTAFSKQMHHSFPIWIVHRSAQRAI